MSTLEIGVAAFGAVYVVLAARNSAWCWPAGIISAALCIVFDVQLHYYIDAILQAYYVLAGFYGWYLWTRNTSSTASAQLQITSYSFKKQVPFLLLGVALTPALGYVFSGLGNAYPYLDSLTAVFSFIATYLTAKRILQSWLWWILIDILLIGQYIVKDANVLAFFYLFLTIMAIYGYFQWRKKFAAHDL